MQNEQKKKGNLEINGLVNNKRLQLYKSLTLGIKHKALNSMQISGLTYPYKLINAVGQLLLLMHLLFYIAVTESYFLAQTDTN